jgi:nucleotide-binding universal stress UspA family protein
MLKKICVGHDGSDNSQRAFDFALEMCALCPGAAFEVSVLSVVVPPELPDASFNADEIVASMKSRHERLLSQLTERAKAKNVELRTELRVGDAAQEILKYIQEKSIDLIIVGQRSKGVIDEFILGSVSRRVVRYATCATTVVR